MFEVFQFMFSALYLAWAFVFGLACGIVWTINIMTKIAKEDEDNRVRRNGYD